ncbi:glioma pathogenesis-related protein 1 isoform 2-T2 [Erethizon dorsatum]
MPETLSMWVTLVTMVWMISFVSSYSYTANTLPDIENEDFIKDCVRLHNKFRSEVDPTASNMLYMTWDPALAQIAKAWAKNCHFEHNPQLKSHKLHPNFNSLGENIWTGSLSLFSVSSAISNWYSEIQYYDFNTQKCKKVCGHYTQIRKLRHRPEEITQLCHIKKEPHAVPAPLMIRVWTISVLIHSETKSHVTTLLCIPAGPYIHVTDTHLSFLLLIHQLYYCLL